MIKQNIFKLICFYVMLFTLNLNTSTLANPIGPYFGETPPGDTAKVFSPNFISRSDWWVQNCCFSSDGREFIFNRTNSEWGNSQILYTNCFNNGEWSEPVVIIDNGLVPYFSHDDQAIYFISYQRNGNSTADIWMSHRNGNDWEEPVLLDSPVSSPDGDEWEIAEPANGILYFSSSRPGGFGNMDVYRSVLVEGKYLVAENLGVPINTSSLDECPWVAPDESFMVYNSWKSNPNFAGNNLYISWCHADGTWTNPKDLGTRINTNYLDIYPYISPDSKYLFYTIRKVAYGGTEPSKLYWISTDFLQQMRYTNFAPYMKSSLEAVTVYKDKEFNFQIPDSLFFDDDGDTLIFSVVKASGTTPEWLYFSPETKILSGIPPKVEKMWLRVTATDPTGEKCSCQFQLVVKAASKVGENSTAPQNHQLGHNYPNPFNPETTITFILSRSCHVLLQVFNMRGQNVKTLIDEFRYTGEYTQCWNGTDESGAPVGAGMYFLQMITGDTQDIRKMLLLR